MSNPEDKLCWLALPRESLGYEISRKIASSISVIKGITLDEKTDLLMFAKGANMW